MDACVYGCMQTMRRQSGFHLRFQLAFQGRQFGFQLGLHVGSRFVVTSGLQPGSSLVSIWPSSGRPSGLPYRSPFGPSIGRLIETQVGAKSDHALTTHWTVPGLAWRIQKIRISKILGTKMVPILGTKMVLILGTKMVPASRPFERARTDAKLEPFWFPFWEPFWFLKWEPFWYPKFSGF